MTAFKFSSLIPRLVAVSAVGALTLGAVLTAQARPLNPVYNSVLDETSEGTPDGVTSPTSFGYFFDTNDGNLILTRLGIPIFTGWANLPGSPTAFPDASTFDVYVWRIDGINQPSLLPCSAVSTPYCQVAKATFDQNQTSSYTQSNGYYWQDITPVDLGKETLSDLNVQYAVAAVGNFSTANGLPTLTGGTGTFSTPFTWTGNGFNYSTMPVAPAPVPSDDYTADFPVPWYYTSDPVSANDPTTFYAYFSPNLSYSYVPSPLPLVGAGAAFGWTRRMRRRIRLASAVR